MGFTSICAIHDSNPRIWRKLIHLACIQMRVRLRWHPGIKITSSAWLLSEVFLLCQGKNLSDYIFDCKDNEELFFALAALRDDSDIHQWFIYDNRHWNDEDPQRFWFICKRESIEDDMCYDAMYADCEKATEAELKVHFNDGDDDPVIKNLQ